MSAHRGLENLRGATVAVVGLGASGRAALDVLTTLGVRAVGIDGSEAAIEAARADLGASVRLVRADGEGQAAAALEGTGGSGGGEGPGGTGPADVVVVSPGIPAHAPVHVRAGAAGVPVWSEIELAWQLQAALPGGGFAPWLALTGTNGKTTTVSMLSTILEAGGRSAPAVGNVGTPAVLVAARGGADALPAELSSFQLHATHSLAPQASAVLNIAPDHLDWHGGYDAYRDAKARIYARTTGACVYTPDPQTRAMVEEADVAEGALAVGVTLGAPGVGQVGVVDGVLCERAFDASRWHAAQELGTLDDLAHLAPAGRELPPHLVLDALVAAAMARAHGVEPAVVRDGLRAYRPGAHRIATVGTIDSVAYVDDSKATNAHAADASLAGIEPGRAVWVAGGLAKGARFEELVARRADRLRAAILIGVDRAPLREALAAHAPAVPVVEIPDGEPGERIMARVVEAARPLARPGDTVLLAPACASMDQFASYADRGEAFARAVAAAQGATTEAGKDTP